MKDKKEAPELRKSSSGAARGLVNRFQGFPSSKVLY